jgi:AcrR family transcriptional regulator
LNHAFQSDNPAVSGSGDSSTRERLLQSATEVFAEKGFRGATVAEICEAAGANIAAVNYHFGDKQRLYSQVWRAGMEAAQSRYPLDGGLDDGTPAEARLRAFINAMLNRTFAKGPVAALARLMMLEMVEPTAALDEMMGSLIQPTARLLDGILRDLVPEADTEERRRACRFSVVSQCVFFNFTRPVRERIMGRADLTPEEIVRLGEHITQFSLAGLQAVRDVLRRETDERA